MSHARSALTRIVTVPEPGHSCGGQALFAFTIHALGAQGHNLTPCMKLSVSGTDLYSRIYDRDNHCIGLSLKTFSQL